MSSKLVLVVGNGRSGTSFLARALNLNGLYLGKDEELMLPKENETPDNPLGHWENWNVYRLNQKLFELNRKRFNIFTKFSNSFTDFTIISKKIIKDLSIQDQKYGWKDPLMLYAFDVWLPVLPEFTLVGIFRDPLKVAESEKTFHSTPYNISLGHWQYNNSRLLNLLNIYGGYLVNFDWSKEILLSKINSISKKIGLNENGDIHSWYHEELKRSDEHFDPHYQLSEEIKTLKNKLEEFANQN